MRRVIGAIIIGGYIAGTAFASEIRQADYSYPSEFVRSLSDKAFVICDDCPPRKSPKSALKTAPTVIALRVSEPDPPRLLEPSNPTIKPEEQNEQTKAATDTCLTIYFDLNSFALHPEDKEKLQAAPSLFEGYVTVNGYTCDIGSDEYNRSLSLKRAEAVADHLRKIGVAPLVITGKGKCCPVSGKKELNRRVEIKEAK